MARKYEKQHNIAILSFVIIKVKLNKNFLERVVHKNVGKRNRVQS